MGHSETHDRQTTAVKCYGAESSVTSFEAKPR
jgi:hypothetical protein